LLNNQFPHQPSHCRYDDEDGRKGDHKGFPEGAEPFCDEAVDKTEVDQGDDEGHEKGHKKRHQKGEEQGFEVFWDHGLPLLEYFLRIILPTAYMYCKYKVKGRRLII